MSAVKSVKEKAFPMENEVAKRVMKGAHPRDLLDLVDKIKALLETKFTFINLI